MASLSKVRARCEAVRKDGVRGKARRRAHVFVCLLSSFTKLACGPVPTEMMDDGMCMHNLLTRQPLH